MTMSKKNIQRRIQALVAALNQGQHRYELLGRLPRGCNGAWLMRSFDGMHVLKLVSGRQVSRRVDYSAACVASLSRQCELTAGYERIGYAPGIGTWYIQSFLPGMPAPYPSPRLVEQMIEFNDRLAHSAPAPAVSGVNWQAHVRRALYLDGGNQHRGTGAYFEDPRNWIASISASGADGLGLVEAVLRFVEPHSGFRPHNTLDIVHGDFQHYNALVGQEDQLTGYIDWDSAGFGDRGLDLSRLLYDCFVAGPEISYFVDPRTVHRLAGKIEEISGRAGLEVYMCFWILQVADFGVKVGPQDAKKFLQVGQSILNELRHRRAVSRKSRSAAAA
jgi:hypothetical protein